MQESDGCRKAFLVSLGLLVSLFLLGFMFAYGFGAAMGDYRFGAPFDLLMDLFFIAVLIFGVWTFLALVNVKEQRKRNLQRTPQQSGDSPTSDP